MAAQKKLNVKKGDRVKVISGKDKGTVGEIIAVDPARERVTVEGVNIVKRHLTDRQAGGRVEKGGIVSSEAPIHVSNVQPVVKKDGVEVVTRVGHKREKVTKTRADGSTYEAYRSVRIAKATGEEF
ncbi:50S ribosomal protein L24 [Raineyella sp. LH-20]|uniref:50S ribosomal protein L24 n=1 Tax=Raineyella sp. LH-20 TaxID=3081204 RepID=UPI0029539162|nr:50S ribosomal protein L24 [Raineyella sp. LH-20]WOP18967.1 50S ribosomal protein L24 [Raineyella sp. LH-20]